MGPSDSRVCGSLLEFTGQSDRMIKMYMYSKIQDTFTRMNEFLLDMSCGQMEFCENCPNVDHIFVLIRFDRNFLRVNVFGSPHVAVAIFPRKWQHWRSDLYYNSKHAMRTVCSNFASC